MTFQDFHFIKYFNIHYSAASVLNLLVWNGLFVRPAVMLVAGFPSETLKVSCSNCVAANKDWLSPQNPEAAAWLLHKEMFTCLIPVQWSSTLSTEPWSGEELVTVVLINNVNYVDDSQPRLLQIADRPFIQSLLILKIYCVQITSNLTLHCSRDMTSTDRQTEISVIWIDHITLTIIHTIFY